MEPRDAHSIPVNDVPMCLCACNLMPPSPENVYSCTGCALHIGSMIRGYHIYIFTTTVLQQMEVKCLGGRGMPFAQKQHMG